MRAVVQRVTRASVTVDDKIIGQIGKGVLVLLGITQADTEKDVDYLVEKIVNLRIFDDENGKMNLSLSDTGGEILAVSQFTLYGDTRRGRRPSYIDAAAPERANELYELFVSRAKNFARVETGQFQAMMQVELVNDGPVTILIDSTKLF
ncbi:MAG TPA: D-aminoacyl-tRNA deacylase [Pyrinomonadaceae bacterium]|jgi:D-tyrosyl-tRNA(Tyr) deacylase|nr:D-aminoacyl-tRNA deacylase [Pyrinomonadaceae bacterium]